MPLEASGNLMLDADGRAVGIVVVARDLTERRQAESRQKLAADILGILNEPMALPDAIIRLRQGFGRLMRRQDDYGAVLIADPRIVRKTYGRYFLDSLPRTRTSVSSLRGVLNAFEDFIVSMRRQAEHPE